MDENLNTFVTEEFIETPTEEIIETEPIVEDLSNDAEAEEIVENVEAEAIETIEVEMEETIGWSGSTGATHSGLYDRNYPDQHLITSITGLREELDEIERLKTVYADKINVANYYKWEDGKAYDTYGYFVSLASDPSEVKICDGFDIFGVSVDGAGFIGGQDATVARDNTYGLITTSGLVDVRCELDVKVGDYVVSNTQGYAKKSGSDYGYRVLATEDKDGVVYAVISLGVQADKTNVLGLELGEVKEQVDTNYKNIISAVNIANQAYNKASECMESNENMFEQVNGALGEVGDLSDEVEDIREQVSNSTLVSAQAKAIAESAATSAESMKNEAVEKANEALADTSELRKELDAKVAEIDTELDNTVLELEATKEGFDEIINDLKLDTEGQLADFKKEVEDNYATTTQLAAVKTENSDAVAALKQEVSDTYATTESVTSLKTETLDALTGFKQEVSETYATQEMLTNLETETGKALTDYKQEVTDTYATQEMVTTLETNTSKALADYKQEVQAGYATQEMVTKLERDTSKALSDYEQEVTDTYATQTSLTTLRTDTTKAIAESEEKATAAYASKSDLTSFEGDANIAMARIEQKADANGAYIQSAVSNMDKYSVGPYSQAYGFTLEQAGSVLEEGMIYVPTETKTGENAETYSYTDDNGDTQTYTREFVKGYLYKWGQLTDYPYGWITVDKDYKETDETNTSSVAVYFTAKEPEVSGNFGYWYTDGDTITGTTGTYEPYTLYKWESYVDENDATQYHWVAVATLAGNSSNRAVSQIRQDANSIAFEVTNPQGSFAGMRAELDETSAKVNSISAWPSDVGGDKYNMAILKQHSDGNNSHLALAAIRNVTGSDDELEVDELGGAKIVLADTANGGSYIQFDADKIDFTAGDFTIDADHIEFTGQKLNIKVDATNIDGSLTIGQLPDSVAETGDIPTDAEIVTISKGAITADYIKTLDLEVGNQIKMGENATISWDNVTNKDKVATKTDVDNAKTEAINSAVSTVDGKGYQTSSQVTQITKDEISTATIRADQVDVSDLNAFEATIGGFAIEANSLHTGNIQNVANTLRYDGVYLGNDGICIYDDSDKTIKGFYVDIDGSMKLEYGTNYFSYSNGGFAIYNTGGSSAKYLSFDTLDGLHVSNSSTWDANIRSVGITPTAIQTYYGTSSSTPIMFNVSSNGNHQLLGNWTVPTLNVTNQLQANGSSGLTGWVVFEIKAQWTTSYVCFRFQFGILVEQSNTLPTSDILATVSIAT